MRGARAGRFLTSIILDAERAAPRLATPNLLRRLPLLGPKPVKLRLTLFLQPNHGFGESFRGSRPDESPKPSISASVPSSDSSRALTSLSQAKLASLESCASANSASFFSLNKACAL